MAKELESNKYYLERISEYEANIKDLLKKEDEVITDCRDNPKDAAIKLFNLSEAMCALASNYLVLNGISLSINNNKNEESLNEARKTLYKAVIYIENVVTAKIAVPFSEYENNLTELLPLPYEKRYKLLQKLGLSIDLLKIAYGDNTKWKWSFVDLEARYATVVKNLFDLKNAITLTRPESPDYETAVYHIRLIKKLLEQSAERFMERYQLATKRPEDLLKAIQYLDSLKYILSVFNDRERLGELQRKLDAWNTTYKLISAKKKI